MAGSLNHIKRIWRFLKRRLGTWSFFHIFGRIATIFSRYGLTSSRFERRLERFVGMLETYGIGPTFPVTASVVERHPELFQKLQKRGVELAVHGYYHVDYTQASEEAAAHFRMARETFLRHGIRCEGFRFPYLKRNAEVIRMLAESGMEWDSSDVVSWEVLSPEDFDGRHWTSYRRILETYEPVPAEAASLLPEWRGGLLEMPVSVPDDDILVERLGTKDDEGMGRIWTGMLEQARKRGGLFVLQAHPERFDLFRNALETVLGKAVEYGDVWIVPLGEVYRWWKMNHPPPGFGPEGKGDHSARSAGPADSGSGSVTEKNINHLWPPGMKCALSITGDIDGINLRDFLERIHGLQ